MMTRVEVLVHHNGTYSALTCILDGDPPPHELQALVEERLARERFPFPTRSFEIHEVERRGSGEGIVIRRGIHPPLVFIKEWALAHFAPMDSSLSRS